MDKFSEKQQDLIELIDHYLPNHKSFEGIKRDIETTTREDKAYYDRITNDIQSYLMVVEREADAFEFRTKAYDIVLSMFPEARKTYVPEYFLSKKETQFEKIKIVRSSDAANFIQRFYSDDIEIYESFFILLLNRANETIGYAKISQGGVAGTVVDVKIIGKYIIDSLASAVIVAHNHPSGNTKPSDHDIKMSKKIRDAIGLIDCVLIDSMIITKHDYYSLKDNGDI